jgi:hypothetical protein
MDIISKILGVMMRKHYVRNDLTQAVASTCVNRTLPLATIMVTLIMFMGSVPSAELAQAISKANTPPTSTTEVIPFSETFYHESRETLASITLAQWGAFSMTTPDSDYCSEIQYYWSSWDCRDAETLSVNGRAIGNVCYGGCYLEFEKYTLELEVVYKYKFEYSGSVTFDTTTEWSETGQPQTTVTLTDSTENIVVSAKAYLDLSIKRYFDGPNSGDMFLRQTLINKEFPYLSPTDIDGGGNGFTVRYNNRNYNFYAWDDYVEFSSLYGENDGLGTKHELDGYIDLATVELLGVIAEYFDNRGLYQYSKPLQALNYFLHLDFGLYLDLEVDLWNRAQLFLGMMSSSAIGSTYNSEGIRSAYNCRLPSTGTMSGSSSSQSCMKGVSGSSDDMYGRLGFRHYVSTKESYSISLVLHAGEGYWASTIWNLIMNQNSYQWQLSRGWLPTQSTETHYTMTSSSAYIATAPAPPPPNSAPSISLADSVGSTSTIITSVGQPVQLSLSASDPDGDSLSGMISWDDGNTTTGLSSSVTHTYDSVGQYEVAAYANDGIATTYSNTISVIVTPQTSALQSLSISVDDLMITEGDTATFTMSSSNPGASFQFVFSDGMNSVETIATSSGELTSTQRLVTYNVHGDFTPNIAAYDADWNLIGYDEVELTVLPDFGNGSIDPSLFEIIGDEILIVIDDADRELSTENKASSWDEGSEMMVTSNYSQAAIIETLNAVSNIRGVDLDYFRVGDSNLDGTVDVINASGPGLSILRHYSTVIWTTGRDYYPLSTRDEAVLETYTGAGGALILFSQDYLWGADEMQTDWAEGTFARDILGVGSSIQDLGEPDGDLLGSDGEMMYNTEYLPLAGLDTIEIVPLENDAYQDHISKDVRYSLLPEWHNFESSSIHGSNSVYGGQNGTTYGSATVGWRTWSFWQRDCSTSSPWSVTGYCSAKTASATHNNMKQLLADIPSSSTMTTVQFDLKVSSEPTYDFLSFSVDGQEVQRWSGSVGWTQFSHTLSPGSHVLEWAYEKDGSVSQGSDAAWIDNVYICCDTGTYDNGRTLEILSDGENNYGLATMLDDGGRVAFISLDPVQILKRYDLETMLLQLIDWAENDWDFDSSADANTIPVGVDGKHPAPTNSGGESWFNVRLFEGQRISIETALTNPGLTEFDIGELSVYDADGVSIQGTSNTSDEWYIEYTAEETGVYQVLVDVDLVGSPVSYQPWYTFSMQTLTDLNTADESLENIVSLTFDGGAYHDALSPLGWSDFEVENEYSTSAYYIGNLSAGDYYGLSITSTESYQYHDVGYVFIDYDLAMRLYRQATNGENDNDGDGIPDDLDPDDDDDGVNDEFDSTPLDRDDDGENDAVDDDDDGNGIDDEDEVTLEDGEFTLLAGQAVGGLFSFDEDVELAIGLANLDIGFHPLAATFGYDIEIWTMPSADASEGGAYHLTEDLQESFWVSEEVDASDNFTVDLPWDEGMIMSFEAEGIVYENSTFAWISCFDGAPVTQVTLSQYTEIEILCDAPYSIVTISIATEMDLMEYSLTYERSQTAASVINEIPMFGINQVEGSEDSWNLESVGPGQSIEIYGDEGGSITFYDLQGQTILTEVIRPSQQANQVDTDRDGYSDAEEQACQSDEMDAFSIPIDTDGDGICDVQDAFPYDPNQSSYPRIISIPSTAESFSISDAGYYGFIVIEPIAQSLSVTAPGPVAIGEMLTIEVSSSQEHNLNAMLTSNRIPYMWNISAPSLEFGVPSHQSVAHINASNVTSTDSWPSVSTDSIATISMNSSDLGAGLHVLTISVESSWTGTLFYDVTLVVNTPPTITGPANLTFESSDIIRSWSYDMFDADGDDLSLLLIAGPPEMVVNASAGMLEWPPAEVGNYTVIVAVDDGWDTTRFTTLVEVTEAPQPSVDDILGCTNETATNYDFSANVDDGSCDYGDNDSNTNEGEDGGGEPAPGQQPQPEDGSDEDSNQKSGSDEYGMTLFIAGTAIIIVLLTVLVSFMLFRRRVDEASFTPDEPATMPTWGAQPPMEPAAVMPAPAMPPDPVPMRTAVARTPQAVEPATRANSYLDLIGGGAYSSDERGTIYTDPSGYEWVQMEDGSFVRLN